MSDNMGLMEDRPFEPHVPEFKDQNGVLRFTQNLRLQVIQTKTRNGAAIGAMSDEDTELVLKAANDIDRQALTAMKLQSDNENADQDRKVAMMAAQLNMTLKRNPFELDHAAPDTDRIPQMDNSLLDAIAVSDLATEIGINNETSDVFLARFAKE